MFITTASPLPYEAHFTLNSCDCCKCTFSIVPNGAFHYFCSWVPVFSSGANGQRLTFPPYKSFLYLKIDTMFTFKLSLFHIGKRKWIKSPFGFPERWSEMKLVHRRFRRECSAVPHTLNGRVGVDRGRNTVWDIIFFLYFWLCLVFVDVRRLSLVTVSKGYALLAVCRLLIAGTSPVAGHGLPGSLASLIMVRWLSCPAACGISQDQEWTLCPLHWQAGS